MMRRALSCISWLTSTCNQSAAYGPSLTEAIAMAEITREKIEQAIKDGRVARSSIAAYLSCYVGSLRRYCKLNDLTWLIPPRQCDIYLIRSVIRSKGVKSASAISKYASVPRIRVVQCMAKHGLDIEGVEADVFWPARVHMGWKEFPRLTNETHIARAIAA